MSMFRKAFIPRAGQAHGRYAAFRINGAAYYRGDCVVIDNTAPTSQGVSGVVAGETLGAHDFIYVTGSAVATDATVPTCHGAGFIEGRKIGDRDTTTALPDDGVVIVQVAGLFRDHAACGTDASAGWVLQSNGGGAVGQSFSVAGVGATHCEQIGMVVGIAMSDMATYTRAAVATAPGCTAWVRCGDIV